MSICKKWQLSMVLICIFLLKMGLNHLFFFLMKYRIISFDLFLTDLQNPLYILETGFFVILVTNIFPFFFFYLWLVYLCIFYEHLHIVEFTGLLWLLGYFIFRKVFFYFKIILFKTFSHESLYYFYNFVLHI